MKTLLAAAVLALSFSSFADEPAADIWKAKCKSCHGDDGKGQTKVGIKEKISDMSTAEYQGKHADADLTKIISEGSEKNKKMKPFKDKLSGGEISSLVKYIRGFKK